MPEATDGTAELPRIGGPLDAVNDAFHGDYGRARDRAAAHGGPVLVLLGDELTLWRGRGSEPEVQDVTPRSYHALKSIAHAPAAVFAILEGASSERPGSATDTALTRLAAHVRASSERLAEDVPDPAARQVCRELLDRLQTFIGEVSQVGVSAPRLDAFARGAGPRLLQIAEHATRVQLAALHERVTEMLARLHGDDRERLHVVVAGAHQARARSLGMQYFKRLLGEPTDTEHRVTYAESIDTVEDAVALVGMQRLDRVMARAFFGDEKRLQRDVLGDAAERLLAEHELGEPGQAV